MRGRPDSPERSDPLPFGALALVTGAGAGIGRATALALFGAGAEVICVDIDSVAAKSTAAETGGTAYAVDVADREAMAQLAATVHAQHGPLDVLVNNAGVGMSGRFLDMDNADWDWILGVNVHGVINGCQLFAPAMLERRRGHVVNLSSGLGYFPRATEPAYCTTKAAVLMLSQSLRADWASSGVGVTAICPGVINTGILSSARFKGDLADSESVAQLHKAFSRGHKPEAVARAVVRSIRKNQGVVPVGYESHLLRLSRRLLPQRAIDRLAAIAPGGV